MQATLAVQATPAIKLGAKVAKWQSGKIWQILETSRNLH